MVEHRISKKQMMTAALTQNCPRELRLCRIDRPCPGACPSNICSFVSKIRSCVEFKMKYMVIKYSNRLKETGNWTNFWQQSFIITSSVVLSMQLHYYFQRHRNSSFLHSSPTSMYTKVLVYFSHIPVFDLLSSYSWGNGLKAQPTVCIQQEGSECWGGFCLGWLVSANLMSVQQEMWRVWTAWSSEWRTGYGDKERRTTPSLPWFPEKSLAGGHSNITPAPDLANEQ